VQYAVVQLSYCHITAPTSGRVGLRLVDSGNTVFAGSSNALVVITQLQPVTVVFNVAEDHLGELQTQLRQHKPLAVEAYDRSAETKVATGTLLTVDNQIDTSTGTVRFRSEFSNGDLALFSKPVRQCAVCCKNPQRLSPHSKRRDSAQWKRKRLCLLLRRMWCRVRNITEQSTDGNTTAVQGLRAGEILALSSFDKLQEGTPVQVEQSDQQKQQSIRELRCESLAPIHSSTRDDCVAYGGDPDRGSCRLHQATYLGITRGAVSDDPSSDFLSGSKSGCDVVRGHSTAGAAIWTDTRSDADDFHEFGW